MQNGKEIRKNNNYIENAGIVIENPVLVNDFTVSENLEYLKKQSANLDEIDLNKWYEFLILKNIKILNSKTYL